MWMAWLWLFFLAVFATFWGFPTWWQVLLLLALSGATVWLWRVVADGVMGVEERHTERYPDGSVSKYIRYKGGSETRITRKPSRVRDFFLGKD